MKLDLKQLFARSITSDLDLVGPQLPPSPRSAKRKLMFVTLAGVLAIVGAAAGIYYFAMRPETLRFAVGPANSNDIKIVQALTQAFAQSHGHVRLRPLQTDNADAFHAQLKAHGVDVDVEVSRFGDAVPPMFWVRDPEGNTLTIVEG